MSVDECVQQAEKEVAKALQFKPVQTIKDWGIEIVIADGTSHCQKLLLINSGCSSSVHKHSNMNEMLYVANGYLVVDIFPQGYNNGFSKRERYFLKEGESITIPPGIIYQFYAPYQGLSKQTKIIETSTKLLANDDHLLNS